MCPNTHFIALKGDVYYPGDIIQCCTVMSAWAEKILDIADEAPSGHFIYLARKKAPLFVTFSQSGSLIHIL